MQLMYHIEYDEYNKDGEYIGSNSANYIAENQEEVLRRFYNFFKINTPVIKSIKTI